MIPDSPAQRSPSSALPLRCSGCGVTLQSESKNKPGYVPTAALQKQPPICQRCYRMKHYNEASTITVNEDDFLKLLGGIAHTDSLVVHIVDLFDFEGSVIAGLQRFIGNNEVLLVVNKIDLLPRVTNWNRLRNWVQRQAKLNGLRVLDVLLCSAKKGAEFDRVVEAIGRLRKARDVYVVGATNVGKSTFVNRLIAQYSDLEQELTVSQYPGTTLDAVHIPLEDGKSIIDTPGIVYSHRLTEVVPQAIMTTLLPDKPLKPLTYQLDARQTLFFGGLARFDFIEGQHQSFTAHLSAGVPVHRTKLERADSLYNDHRGRMLAPPSEDQLDQIPPWTRHRFRLPAGEPQDIVISGLGWLKANGRTGALIDVHAPSGVKVLLREAMI